jgi:hypothetical protein
MPLSKQQNRLLHVAKAKLGLSEDAWRSCLVQLAGVESSTELDRDGFDAIMGYFAYLGFHPVVPRGPTYGARPGFATPAQVQFIRDLWAELTRGAAEDALNKWLKRCWKVDSLRFLTAGDARKAITALKAMKKRAA